MSLVQIEFKYTKFSEKFRFIETKLRFLFLFIISSLLFSNTGFCAEVGTILNELESVENQQSEVATGLENEKNLIAEQIEKLKQRKEQLVGRITELQTEITIPFRREDLAEFMEKQFGVCDIEKGETSSEYIIKKGGEETFFFFGDLGEKPIGQISKKTIGLQNTPVIEVNIHQSRKEGREDLQFKALVRLDIETLEVVHATFTGYNIDNGFLGLGKKYIPNQVVCKL